MMFAKRDEDRELFKRAVRLVWASVVANSYLGQLSGPHSRDYDFLQGNGMLYAEMYGQGLPGTVPLRCNYRDPHCVCASVR